MLVVFLRRHKTDLQRIRCQGSASPVTTTTVNIASIAMETSLYLRRNILGMGGVKRYQNRKVIVDKTFLVCQDAFYCQ